MKSNFKLCVVICALTMAVCSFAPSGAWADSPESVVLSYDMGTQTLTANIKHNSIFPGLHYVKQVEIRKNNQTILKNEYSSQPDRKSFSYTYTIPARENDLLEVIASCNIQGQKTATLKAEPKKD